MRSILQEAPSIPKAIEKAWNEAGRPQEFSVKVFDVGERNFLGFTKRPAVVSLIFDPKKSEKPEVKQTGYKRDPKNYGSIQPTYAKRQKHDYQNRNDSYSSDRYNRDKQREEREEKRHMPHQAQKPAYIQQPEEYDEPHVATPAEKEQPKERHHGHDNRMWPQEFRDDVKNWLKNLAEKMEINTPFSMRPEGHLLKIEFEKPILEGYNEERMVFSSFAYILMQFLKRKHKKRFKGCRLAIVSKR